MISPAFETSHPTLIIRPTDGEALLDLCVHALGRAARDGLGPAAARMLTARVIGYSTLVPPYQASPVVVAMAMGGVPARDETRLCLVLAVVTLVLLLPLTISGFERAAGSGP